MTKITGSESASGSINQRHGSADPDPDPVMDPQHCFKGCNHSLEDEYERGDESRPESQADQSESHLGIHSLTNPKISIRHT